ncbi:MAG TPA: RNA methyltransferase [Opitutaceae bacterium]|nr:RNA methyltransferase [Opitutaceae bacterium]
MPTNAELRHLRRLHEERYRREAGLFVVEGDKSVREFLSSGRFELTLYALDSWKGETAASSRIAVTPDEMARISHFPSPPEVLAVGRVDDEPLAPGALTLGLTLALDAVQDPGNVGTILRTADWFGVDRVVLGEGCADPFSQKAVNASKGSLARVRVHRADLRATLATAGVPVFGCDLGGEDIHTLAAPRDAVIVIGSEGRGLSDAVRASISRFVTIPARGAAESLNAALAAAVILDNWRRLAR